MSTFITSPNMNLPIPVVGQDPGPDYAINIDNALTLIDRHDHTPGNGVQITPQGLDINSTLDFNDNFATNLAGVNMDAQVSTPANGTVYIGGVDLFYTDLSGNNIRITQTGAVAGTPGSITNLVAPASASYVAASKTFVFQSDVNIAANLDAASILLRNISPNSTFALTLSPPNSLASNFTLTLPVITADIIGGQPNIMTMDGSGNMASVTSVDNSTIVIASNIIKVPTGGITGLQLSSISNTSTTTPGSGTYVFTIASSSVTSGATYTNNGVTFTVTTTISSGTTLTTTATTSSGVASSGTLTKSGGTGPATIAYSTIAFRTTFTVPSGVTEVTLLACGGGGGGGGGGSQGGSGGAGGAGSVPMFARWAVTAANVIQIDVGIGGLGGSGGAGSGSNNGADGAAGGTTTITNTTTSTQLMKVAGGSGGAHGLIIGNPGGVAGTTGWLGNKSQAGGGAGGTSTSSGQNGSSGTDSIYGSGGSGGAGTPNPGSFVGGGGGGGGAGYTGAGASGGQSGQSSGAGGANGATLTTIYGAGGGGGGGAAGGGTNNAGSGGGAAPGMVIIQWFGHS